MKMDGLRIVGGGSVDLPLLSSDVPGPFALRSAEGLGPTEVTVRMSRRGQEISAYHGKTSATRQITALVSLMPDWYAGQTPEELRTELYSLMNPRYGQMLRCEIMYEGEVQGYVEGQISKFETALFAKDPAVLIVIDCNYPYILAPESITTAPSTYSVGGIRGFEVYNEGTAPSGFIMGFSLTTTKTGTLILADENPLGQKMHFEGPTWTAGSRIIIDTRPGSRGAWIYTAPETKLSLLPFIKADISQWLQLHYGSNHLTINASGFNWDSEHQFTHHPEYLGV